MQIISCLMARQVSLDTLPLKLKFSHRQPLVSYIFTKDGQGIMQIIGCLMAGQVSLDAAQSLPLKLKFSQRQPKVSHIFY